jgi:hypothetical protein
VPVLREIAVAAEQYVPLIGGQNPTADHARRCGLASWWRPDRR